MGVKIRGIYATALTRLCVDHNLAIVLPSQKIKERLRDYEKIDSPEPVDMEIRDLEDQQGQCTGCLKNTCQKLNKTLRRAMKQ